MHELLAHNVGITFPVARGVVPSETDETDNFIRNRRGKLVGLRALDSVSFHLRSGDRLALIGANGAGKSTLLQLLSGTYLPDTGVIEMRGRATSLVNINVGIQLDATGHRNITLRGLIAGQSRAAIEERRQWIAEFSELGDFLHLPFRTYSAGMRMRLNFAIATAFTPDILLMDEWLSAGDARFREKASQRMTEIVDSAGILVLASHSVKMLEQNCNQAIWLHKGRIQAYGSVSDTFAAFAEQQARDRATAAKVRAVN